MRHVMESCRMPKVGKQTKALHKVIPYISTRLYRVNMYEYVSISSMAYNRQRLSGPFTGQLGDGHVKMGHVF